MQFKNGKAYIFKKFNINFKVKKNDEQEAID